LETWYAGTQGGHAVADVIFGDYNPSGKLTVTFPLNEGQIPIFYSMKNSGRPLAANNKFTSKYLDIKNSPQFPFGFGLSYTTFAYTSVKASQTIFRSNDELKISVTISNTGDFDGEEVVQLYIRDLVGSTTRPIKELKKFAKVLLKKGTSKQVDFTLTTDDLAFYTQDMSWKAEPGTFEIFVGGDSNTQNMVKVELVK
jgi:beta-glucosidase